MDHALPEPLRVLTDPARLWEVLEALPLRVTVLEYDPDGAIRLAATDMTGGGGPEAPAAALGMDLRRHFDPQLLRYLDEAHRTGRPVRCTAPLTLPDGTERVVDSVNIPLPDGRILVMSYNLTDRVDALEQARRYTAEILRSTSDRFWVTGADMIVRHYEGPAIGQPAESIVGRSFYDLYPPAVVARFADAIERTLASGTMERIVAESPLDRGLVNETRIVPFGEGEVLVATRDVTELHRNQRIAEQRGVIDGISSRGVRRLFDLVGDPLLEAASALLGEVAESIGAGLANLGRRIDDDGFERVCVWTSPAVRAVMEQMPRLVRPRDLPTFFRETTGTEPIVVRSVDVETYGSLAEQMLGHVRARSALVVPLQTDDALIAYLSFYWFDDSMPEVEAMAESIRSFGMNMLAAVRRAEAELARLEATENLEHALGALRVNEERFRLLSRATNDVLWDWDLTTNALWWGDGITTLFGYDRTELEPTIASWEQRIHPDDADRAIGSLKAAVNAGARSWVQEYRFIHQRGGYLWVLDRGELLHDSEGRPVRMVGGMRDITERRRAETLLREQAQLLDAANDVIYERDLAGRITYWNRAAQRTYGWSVEDVLGRSVHDVLRPDPERFAAAMEALMRDGEWSGELRHRDAEGNEVIVEARWALVTGEHGEPQSILAINTDITERRRWEQHLLRAQRMESIGTLAGGIAHDLNNILTPILMTTEMLRADEDDPGRQASLATIEVAAQRGADLVRRVLTFARGMEGGNEDVEVDDLFAELAAFLSETFPRNIEVRVHDSAEPLHVAGDRTQLSQVLLNLCVNARDAMPDGGELVVAAERRPVDDRARALGLVEDIAEFVVITVADTGTGISGDITERIFEPFFTTKPHGAGTGLGLATAMAIVRGHNGVLEFDSRPGAGTTFTVWLPSAGSGRAHHPSRPESAAPDGHGEVVLVVDDEDAVVSAVHEVLRSHGYRVRTARNGEEALAALKDADPPVDLVVTDLMMPGPDGVETALAVHDVCPGVPVVVASGVKTDDAVARAHDAGIHHFLAKPYTVTTLLTTVRDALAQGSKR